MKPSERLIVVIETVLSKEIDACFQNGISPSVSEGQILKGGLAIRSFYFFLTDFNSAIAILSLTRNLTIFVIRATGSGLSRGN
jgi:hypothetical protein